MSPEEFIQKSDIMQSFFEETIPVLGRQTKFVQRESKLTALKFVLSLVLGWLDQSRASLNDLVKVCGDLEVPITESGLQQRFTPAAVDLLKQALDLAITDFQTCTQPLPSQLLQQFSAVMIVDSTIVTLPEAMAEMFAGFASKGSQAAIKFQLAFDYLSGNLCALEQEAGRRCDQSSTLIGRMIQKGALMLFDLGYFNQKTFAQIDEQDAFFVSRYKFGTNVYAHQDDDQALDLLAQLRAYQGSCFERTLFLGRQQRLSIRLVATRLPQSIVDERRRKAKQAARKKGHTPPKAYLELLAWSIYITNCSPEQLSAKQITAIYRVRWQIELLFKTWKSVAHLADVGQFKAERTLCQLYARLIGIVLFHWLVAPWRMAEDHREVSLPKAFRTLKRHITRLLDSIVQGWTRTPQILERIIQDIQTYDLKDQRLKNPSTLDLLEHQSP